MFDAACYNFHYILLVIISAAAVKTGLFGVNGALVVDKHKDTTVTARY